MEEQTVDTTTMSRYSAFVEADTVWEGNRITTVVVTYPRIIHSEVMTHRMIVKNSSSSRAIPARKMIEQVENEMFIPLRFGAHQPGMQMADVDCDDPEKCREYWINAGHYAVDAAKDLLDHNVHKSVINRILEPWSWITVIMTATEWQNFFVLRRHPDADIHIHYLADRIHEVIRASEPKESKFHAPFISDEEMSRMHANLGRCESGKIYVAELSAARCARVSYLTHDGQRSEERDLQLAARLRGGSGGVGHWSPFEHFAMASADAVSPYVGWQSYRSVCRNNHVKGHIR